MATSIRTGPVALPAALPGPAPAGHRGFEQPPLWEESDPTVQLAGFDVIVAFTGAGKDSAAMTADVASRAPRRACAQQALARPGETATTSENTNGCGAGHRSNGRNTQGKQVSLG